MTRRQVLFGTAGGAALGGAEIDWTKASEEAMAHLRGYLRLDTSNPPGHTAAAATYLAGILAKNGIRTERIESVPGQKVNLLARLKGNGRQRPVLLLNHMDTVPADRTRWQTDPFGAEIRLNRLWGRGTVDMKSTGIVHLMALVLLQRQSVRLGRDVIFAAAFDEETGGAGAKFLLAKHPEKVEAEYVFDEGGFSANRLFTDEGEVHGVSVAQKQVLWLRLSVEGTAGHGSQPTDDNAPRILSRALARITEAEPPRRTEAILDVIESRLGKLADNRFANAIRRNTISLTTLRAGVGEPPKDNVIPSLATATLDCRLLPSQPHTEFIEWVRRTGAEPKLKVEIAHYTPAAPPSPANTELFRLIEATVAKHSPRARVIPYLTPFGTDGNHFRRPDRHVYGFFPAVMSAEEAMSMHSDAERIPVAPFEKGLRIFYEVVAGIAGVN
jgi:acetylornithine deacetylase/succinyl-diaminopimelate desuccinylase-like protein